MIKVEDIDVFGWEAAIRGMRNPMNSWKDCDSKFLSFVNGAYDIRGDGVSVYNEDDYLPSGAKLGYNDINLMKRLIKGGSEERKFLRMVHVQMDITAPLYWWKEFDTYKVGTVANSCSTMHKIADKEFTLDDFSHEHVFDADSKDFTAINIDGGMCLYTPTGLLGMICNVLNHYRQLYLDTKNKDYWWQMIQLLPSSYNQRRTVDFNYETALSMIHQRRNHKLDEWRIFCLHLFNLPYMEVLYDD